MKKLFFIMVCIGAFDYRIVEAEKEVEIQYIEEDAVLTERECDAAAFSGLFLGGMVGFVGTILYRIGSFCYELTLPAEIPAEFLRKNL